MRVTKAKPRMRFLLWTRRQAKALRRHVRAYAHNVALEQAHAIAREDSQKTLGKGAGIIGARRKSPTQRKSGKQKGQRTAQRC